MTFVGHKLRQVLIDALARPDIQKVLGVNANDILSAVNSEENAMVFK